MRFEKGGTGRTERAVFMPFSYGEHRVRLLGEPRRVFTHYLRGKATIECLGSECPICQNNKSIESEFPEDYRDRPGYNGSSPRHYLNVLDRTPVKICTNTECQNEIKADAVGNYPPQCPKCNTFLSDSEPKESGKVKVINISQTNADIIDSLDLSVLDENKEPIGNENFDIVFKAIKTGNRKSIVPMPDTSATDKVEVPEDALFDLSTIVIKLEPDEIIALQKGISLRDIFAARRTDSFEKDDEVIDEKLEEEIKDAEQTVLELFPD